jgi:hypothetical protein
MGHGSEGRERRVCSGQCVRACWRCPSCILGRVILSTRGPANWCCIMPAFRSPVRALAGLSFRPTGCVRAFSRECFRRGRTYFCGDSDNLPLDRSGRTGMGNPGISDRSGAGVGLNNVRRRLQLCFGMGADLVIDSGPTGTCVRFAVPLNSPARTASERVVAQSTLG